MKRVFFLLLILAASVRGAERRALVLQSDFGVKDGAVAAMKGVAVGVDLSLPIFDLSHANTPYDIWEAAYRLKQTVAYWPAGTVFVSVVDPGVGTDRKSVVLKTKSGHYIVTPDNGTLTLVAEDLGIEAVRRINETRNRLAGSDRSYTFHGRDVYSYTGARLAAGKISFEDVGPMWSACPTKRRGATAMPSWEPWRCSTSTTAMSGPIFLMNSSKAYSLNRELTSAS